MERKEFLKSACSICVAIGAGVVLGALESCSNLPIYKTKISENKISVPSSIFEQTDLHIIRPNGFEFDIALRKVSEGQFTALLLRCTHADNQLTPTDTSYVCSLHGSKFDKNGHVVKSPAEKALKRYKTELVEGNIIIYVSSI